MTMGKRSDGMLAVRIYMDGNHWDGALHRTIQKNLGVAWKRLTCDIPKEYLPKSKEEFIARGGKISRFKSF